MGGPCDTCDGDPFLYVVHEGNPITVRCPDCAVAQLERADRQVVAVRETVADLRRAGLLSAHALKHIYRALEVE